MYCRTAASVPFQALTIAALLVANLWNPAETLAQYRTAQEAYSAGAKLYNARQFAEARAPFEAAIELSDDPKLQVKSYRALMQSYRQLPEIDQMLKAVDFIFEHGESSTEKSLTARALTAFVHERGKTAEAIKIYEAKLNENPRSKPALYALEEIYRRAEPNPTRRGELTTRLAEVQRQDEAALAEKFEKLATDQPNLAAAHYKDAAVAWQRASNSPKALEALANAENSGPEARNDLLAYFWHKSMADTYLALQEPKRAIGHYEQAIKKTSIDGYLKDCQEQLVKARQAAGN